MFVAIAGHENAAEPGDLAAMVGALRGGATTARSWREDNGAAGFAAAPRGILPEEVFDRQPLVDETWAVASDARLDNRAQLATDLGLAAAEAAILADGDILARAFRRWGEKVVDTLYGDYAFVAWERPTGRLIAATSHLGSWPLFYFQDGARIILASQMAALMAHRDAPRDLDVRILGLMVAPRAEVGRTVFSGVRYLPGGSILTFDRGTVQVRRWWRPRTAADLRYRNAQDYVDHANELLSEAVTQRLRALGEISTSLSGGLDSTLVSSRAARRLADQGRRLHAFTSVPQPGLAVVEREHWDADDGPFAAAVARLYPNMTHSLVHGDGVIPLDYLPAVHAHAWSPGRNSGNLGWILKISALAQARGSRVVLEGGGGNATLSSDPGTRWARFRAGLRYLGQDRRQPRLRFGAIYLSAPFCAAHGCDLQRMQPSPSARDRAIEFMQRVNRTAAPDTMAQFGVEWRDPTSDRRLIETLLRFPLQAFRAGGQPRGLAREMGRGWLPDEIRLRRRRGAQSADEAAWFATRPADYLAPLAALRRSDLCAEFLNLDRVERDLKALCAGEGDPANSTSIHRVFDVGMFALAYERGDFAYRRAIDGG